MYLILEIAGGILLAYWIITWFKNRNELRDKVDYETMRWNQDHPGTTPQDYLQALDERRERLKNEKERNN